MILGTFHLTTNLWSIQFSVKIMPNPQRQTIKLSHCISYKKGKWLSSYWYLSSRKWSYCSVYWIWTLWGKDLIHQLQNSLLETSWGCLKDPSWASTLYRWLSWILHCSFLLFLVLSQPTTTNVRGGRHSACLPNLFCLCCCSFCFLLLPTLGCCPFFFWFLPRHGNLLHHLHFSLSSHLLNLGLICVKI